MKKIIITVGISLLLILLSCKKCYNCSNGCGTQVSTGQMICSDQFSSDQEWGHLRDSLATDFYVGSNSYSTFNEKVCSEEERIEYEDRPGIGCIPVRD